MHRKAKKMGRPEGSKNVKTTTTTELSRCPACGDTRRRKLGNKIILEHGGIKADGRPYTHTVWQRVQCERCEQVRKDRTLENWPDGPDVEE
jgi:hypothetical protein